MAARKALNSPAFVINMLHCCKIATNLFGAKQSMREPRRLAGKPALVALLFVLCAACADQNGGLSQACSDATLDPKPAACGDDLQQRMDDVTRATTDIQRIRQSGAGAGR